MPARLFRRRSHPSIPSELLTQLESLGFYQHATDQEIAEARARTQKTGSLFHESTRRLYHADAEDLAEGQVALLLEDIRPFLEHEGVTIATVEEDFGPDSYSITVNGTVYPIYSGPDLETQRLWEVATRQTLQMINHMLEDAGSAERAYLLYGGHDAHLVFLTPAMHAVITASPAIPANEQPQPVDEL